MDHQNLLSSQTSAFVSPALRQVTIQVEKVGGINLGQGVCQLPVPPFVIEAATKAARDGINRYTNPRGLLSLRESLSNKLKQFNGIESADPESNVLVTCGATGGFEAVCGTLLNPGDEVVVFEPYYPYHIQALRRYGAVVKFVTLGPPNWELDVDALKAAVDHKTKFVLINTPGNPTGKVFSRTEIEQIAEVLEPFECLLVTDEIYEYMTFDGSRHVSPASLQVLPQRIVTLGGYSKTFSITGWRVGYALVPDWLSGPMSAFLDAVYVCAPAPLQQAVADGINQFDSTFYADLCDKYDRKRSMFANGLRSIGLEPIEPNGAYYMVCSYAGIEPNLSGGEFVSKMIAETGVGAVPASDFVQDAKSARWIRFCLAVEDQVLEDALARMRLLSTVKA